MKVISWNINGIRAIYKKDFLSWFKKTDADIVCLQEIKAQEEQVPEALVNPKGYYSYFNPAERKGYSGTAIFTKEKPISVERKAGFDKFDNEGRLLRLEFSSLILINFYIPFGGKEKENLEYKLKVYKYLLKYLKEVKDKKVVLVGDFNIAHQEIDLVIPKENKNSIMFTPEERKQIDELINLGFIDSFRELHKDGEHYSFWSYMTKARERNVGWRLDYVFISKSLKLNLKKAFIMNKVMGSDHCPVGITINC